MKQEIKVVALALAMVLIFLSGVIVGKTTGEIKITLPDGGTLINNEVNAGSAGGSAPVNGGSTNTGNTGNTGNSGSTDANTGNSGSTDANTGNSGSTDANTDNSGSTDANTGNSGSSTGVPSTKEEIAAAYNKAINDYRAFKGKVTLKKSETINIGVTDLPALAATVVNKVVEGFTGTTTEEFTFENGVDVADPNRYIDHKMIPGGRDAAVKAEGLASATATPNADGGYTLTMVFVAEDSIFDGQTNTSEPTFHMGAMDPLNLGTLDLGPISISRAELHYPGATTTATIDGQGRLVKLENKLPLEGFGTGKAVIELTINMSGSMDSVYEMTYA